jgi:hypothetical protein
VLRASAELRLTRRETFIRDVLLPLARRTDERLRQRSYVAALGLGFPPERAKALAAAVVILDAVEGGGNPEGGDGRDGGHDPDTTDLLREIGAVSRALRHPDVIREVRARAVAPEDTAAVIE